MVGVLTRWSDGPSLRLTCPNPSAPACQWQSAHPEQSEPATKPHGSPHLAPAETAAELFPSHAAPKTTATARSLPSGRSPV